MVKSIALKLIDTSEAIKLSSLLKVERNTSIIKLIIACFFLFFNVSFAQNAEIDTIANKLLFEKEIRGGIALNSNGVGVDYKYITSTNYFKKNLYEVSFSIINDAKEIRVVNPFVFGSKRYKYGKLNEVFALRLGYGKQKLHNEKPQSTGGIELRAVYSFGLSVMLTKPIYLYIIEFDNVDKQYVTRLQKYNPDKHFGENIYAPASFTRGLNEIKPYLGAYVKYGLNVEFGKIAQRPKSIEAGILIDAFIKGVPIIAFKKVDTFFVSLYISYSIGRRYN